MTEEDDFKLFLKWWEMHGIPFPTSHETNAAWSGWKAAISAHPKDTPSDHIVDANKKVDPVAYAAKVSGHKWAYIWHEKDDVQGWINLQHQSQDNLTYVGPIPLYAHPAPPSDLVQAAESAERLLSELVAYGFETNEDYDVLDNLRAALKPK